jgi:putative FmdB family regulatory protein
MDATIWLFRCMACGHEYENEVRKDEDKERSCPDCRSNSIRQLKRKPAAKGESDARTEA